MRSYAIHAAYLINFHPFRGESRPSGLLTASFINNFHRLPGNLHFTSFLQRSSIRILRKIPKHPTCIYFPIPFRLKIRFENTLLERPLHSLNSRREFSQRNEKFGERNLNGGVNEGLEIYSTQNIIRPSTGRC